MASMTVHVPLSWQKKRVAVGELLLLRVNKKPVGLSKISPLHGLGRVRGINFAALWILFADALSKTSLPVAVKNQS